MRLVGIFMFILSFNSAYSMDWSSLKKKTDIYKGLEELSEFQDSKGVATFDGLYERFIYQVDKGNVGCPLVSQSEDSVCLLTKAIRSRMAVKAQKITQYSDLIELYLVPEIMSRLVVSDIYSDEFYAIKKNDYQWIQKVLDEMKKDLGSGKLRSLIRDFPQIATLMVLDRWLESAKKGGDALFLFDGHGEDLIKKSFQPGRGFAAKKVNVKNPKGLALKEHWYEKIRIASYFEAKSDLLAQEIAAGKKILSEKIHPSVSLLKMGISNTIYTFIYPETTSIVENLWKSASYLDLHGAAYLRKQDGINEVFFNKYLNWSSDTLHGLKDYPHRYISHGSMEAIKTTFCQIRVKHPKATLHVFEGEFEGAIFAAKACGLPLKKHPRPKGKITLKKSFKKDDFFYLSQPRAC